MFPDCLQNTERPAEALAHEATSAYRGFGVSEGTVFVDDAVSAAQHIHGQIGVFGYGVHMIAAGLANDFGAPRSERPGNDRHCSEQI